MIRPSLLDRVVTVFCIWRSRAKVDDGITSRVDHGENSKSMQGTRAWSLGQDRDDVGDRDVSETYRIRVKSTPFQKWSSERALEPWFL